MDLIPSPNCSQGKEVRDKEVVLDPKSLRIDVEAQTSLI
jgi:hypothetical protein